MKTKEEILLNMVETMPFEINSAVKPYLMEAMDIYAEEYHQEQLKSNKTPSREGEGSENKYVQCSNCERGSYVAKNNDNCNQTMESGLKCKGVFNHPL